jgi:glycosyltransferase involved in cell wall biosynthesis
MSKKVLFISYDGMTDPLGQSQVIPYLAGLQLQGYTITILSFEKKQKMKQLGKFIHDLLKRNHIYWVPLRFHQNPKIISKALDIWQMKRVAKHLHKKNKYALIHCRSYIAAGVGLSLKKRTGVKFLFDMRGFWADEKTEGGNWKKNNFFWNQVYRYYKRLEKKLIRGADHIISLTKAAKTEIQHWKFYNPEVPVTVIPCCADSTLFSLNDKYQQHEAKKLLDIPVNAFVLGYLGSVGAWYMLDEMLAFFNCLKKRYPQSVFLFITNSPHEVIYKKLPENGLQVQDVRIVTVNYKEVPVNIKAADINISFIKPVYSKTASSPTKNGEILSMGIPIILNDIGDSGVIIEKCQAGFVINQFNADSYRDIINRLDEVKKMDPLQIRNNSLEFYSLERGIEKYSLIYSSMITK